MDTPRPRLGILEFTQSVLGIRPYPWQRTTLVHIEAGHPTTLTACNGAGKTSTVLVSAALWCHFNWPLARVIVTSASWSQLKKQFFDTIRLQARHPLFRSHTFNEAEVTMTLPLGQLKRHQRAAATRTVDVLPAPLQAVKAVG